MANDLVIADAPAISAGSDANGNAFASSQAVVQRGGRRAEIEKIRDTDINRYFREGLDKELIQFLKEDTGELQATEPMLPEQSRKQLAETAAGRRLAQEWDRMSSFKIQLSYVQDRVGSFVRDLGDEREQRAFMERFDRSMPEDVRYAIYDMITTAGDNAFVTPANEEGIRIFCSGPVCPELVEEWGAEAPEKVARIWRRMGYLKLVCDDVSPIFDWFDQLTDKEAKSVLEFAAR